MSKWINKFLKKEPINETDRADKPISEGHLSVLSVPPKGTLDQDYFYTYEERVAIAEYDGHQTLLQVQRIAYLDAFLSILFDSTELDSQREWLIQKVQSSLNKLETHHFPTHH